MSTVKLICTECNIIFFKDKHEISRRKAKGPSQNFFCTKACCMSWRRKRKTKQTTPPIHPGNQYGRKYDERVAWYVRRCSFDQRFANLTDDDRKLFAKHLLDIWTGKCAITDKKIKLRDKNGCIDDHNPFQIASIDRIDNKFGYELNNVQWVCLAMNLARQNIDLATFKQYYKESLYA